MSRALAGRRVLVTGAAKGIGLATVARFVAEGAGVAALDRDREALSATGDRFKGATVYPIHCDVADEASVAQAVAAAASALQGLDGVVNAAGIDLIADIEAMS